MDIPSSRKFIPMFLLKTSLFVFILDVLTFQIGFILNDTNVIWKSLSPSNATMFYNKQYEKISNES